MNPNKVELYTQFSIGGVVLYTLIVGMLIFAYIDFKRAKQNDDQRLRKKCIIKFIAGPVIMVSYFIIMLLVFRG